MSFAVAFLCATLLFAEVLHYRKIKLLCIAAGERRVAVKKRLRHISPHRKALDAKRRTNE